MGETSVPTGLTVQQWDNKYFKEFLNKDWFKAFSGTGSNKMIQVKEDLTKKDGDSVTFTLVNKLTGTAKDSDEDLEGNEEGVDLRSQKVTIREYAHAVKFKKFDNQKTAIDLRESHKDVLMDWNMELHRDNVIEALGSINGVAYASATETNKDAWLVDNADRVLFGAAKSNNSSNDHSASLANIDSTTDVLKPGALSLMKRMALQANPKIRPIREKGSISGSNMYVILAGTYPLRDLKNDSTFLQANREARARGKLNPIFSDADYIYDNLAIYEIEDLPIYEGVGQSSIDVAPVYLCGAQAVGTAWAMRPNTVDEEFDYKRRVGIGIKQWYKVEKLRFGSGSTDTADLKDHGIVTGYFSSVADS